MRKQTNLLRAIHSLIFILAWMGTAMPFAVAEAAKQEVRVGFFHLDGYHQIDDLGIRSGYGYDFLQMISGYTGFAYQYEGYDKSWSEMFLMLDEGEIDLLTSVQYTEERADTALYHTKNVGRAGCTMVDEQGNVTGYWKDDKAEDYSAHLLEQHRLNPWELLIDEDNTRRLFTRAELCECLEIPEDTSPQEIYQSGIRIFREIKRNTLSKCCGI